MSSFWSDPMPFEWKPAVTERDRLGAQVDALSYIPTAELRRYQIDADPGQTVVNNEWLAQQPEQEYSVKPYATLATKAAGSILYITCSSLLRPGETVEYAMTRSENGIVGFARNTTPFEGPILVSPGRVAAVLQAAASVIELSNSPVKR